MENLIWVLYHTCIEGLIKIILLKRIQIVGFPDSIVHDIYKGGLPRIGQNLEPIFGN